MSKGEILFNLRNLDIGEKIKIYSSAMDVLDNEVVEVYYIEKKEDGFYISSNKKISFEEDYSFKEHIAKIGVSDYNKDHIKNMALSKYEINSLKNRMMEEGIIRKGYSLVGTLSSGYNFEYPNIIMVTKG